MMAGDGRIDPDDPVLHAAAEAFGEYTGMCAELIEARRGSAETDDIISILTNAEDSGLTSDELLMFLTLLVVAGNETTRNALTGGLVAFRASPTRRTGSWPSPSSSTPPSTRSCASSRRSCPSAARSPRPTSTRAPGSSRGRRS